jgi:hypothetical protein
VVKKISHFQKARRASGNQVLLAVSTKIPLLPAQTATAMPAQADSRKISYRKIPE